MNRRCWSWAHLTVRENRRNVFRALRDLRSVGHLMARGLEFHPRCFGERLVCVLVRDEAAFSVAAVAVYTNRVLERTFRC